MWTFQIEKIKSLSFFWNAGVFERKMGKWCFNNYIRIKKTWTRWSTNGLLTEPRSQCPFIILSVSLYLTLLERNMRVPDVDAEKIYADWVLRIESIQIIHQWIIYFNDEVSKHWLCDTTDILVRQIIKQKWNVHVYWNMILWSFFSR